MSHATSTCTRKRMLTSIRLADEGQNAHTNVGIRARDGRQNEAAARSGEAGRHQACATAAGPEAGRSQVCMYACMYVCMVLRNIHICAHTKIYMYA